MVSARGQLGHTQPLLRICHCDCPLCLLALYRGLGITWARGHWSRGLCLLHSLFLRQSLIVIDLCHGLWVRGWRHGGLQCLHVTCQHSMVTCDDVFSANNNPLVTCCHAHDGDVDITTGWQPLNTQGQGQQDTHSLVTIAGSYRAARAQSTDQSWSFTPGSPPASRAQDTAWCRLACVHRARGARSIQRPWEISQSTDCRIKTSFKVSPRLKAM